TGEFLQCVQNRDLAMLTRVPGIGKKTAERMILEMRDRLEVSDIDGSFDPPADDGGNAYRDAVSALLALGYNAREAEAAVEAVRATSESRDELIRNALKHLSR
ncbi:MAG: Holliday junction branch migration protein RuvA, partial [Gammaproteobacteria bacterium]|nr:Holliday junction branch migration protein RuvA [Gammaproteobacteria bacterium]